MKTTTARRARSSAMPASPMNYGPMTDPLAPCTGNDFTEQAFTEDGFLGGQLRLRQLKSGHRAGHDAMLLAAATSARSGDRLVDFGAGLDDAGLRGPQGLTGIKPVLVENG